MLHLKVGNWKELSFLDHCNCSSNKTNDPRWFALVSISLLTIVCSSFRGDRRSVQQE